MDLETVKAAFLAAVGPEGRPAEVRFASRIRRHPQVLALRFERTRRIVDLIGGRGKTLLDAGSGTGLNAVLALLAGAREVWAVELNPFRLEVARDLIGRLGLEDRLHLLERDILEVDLPAGSLGGIYSNEFLEHIVDSEAYHRLAGRWLEPGGRIYGRTGANAANLWYRITYGRQWSRTDRLVYAPARRGRIRDLAPELPEEVLDRLVRGTRGAGPAEIEAAVTAWRQDGRVPPANRKVPKNPETGVYYERLRRPRQLLAEMEGCGLAARLLPPDLSRAFTASPARRALLAVAGPVVRWAHPASLVVAPWIEVLGERRA